MSKPIEVKLQSIYKHTSNCVLETMGEEVLLYNPVNTEVLYLNASSLLIYQLCDGKRSLEVIIDLLKQTYPECLGQIEGDVVSAIDSLVKGCALELIV